MLRLQAIGAAGLYQFPSLVQCQSMKKGRKKEKAKKTEKMSSVLSRLSGATSKFGCEETPGKRHENFSVNAVWPSVSFQPTASATPVFASF